MKDIQTVDFDDLYDSSPSGSEDEYVPDTTCESSDSESEVTIEHNRKTKRHAVDDALDNCASTSSDVRSHLPYESEEEPSREEQQPCQTVNEGVTVDPFHKSDGKRVYNKRHYCLYCLKPYAKMARHLESAHIDKADVARALSFSKGSKER